MAVAYPVQGGKLSILDTAGNYYTGERYGSLRSSSYSVAVNDWLSHRKNQMLDAEIAQVFSESVYKKFSSTNKFLEWVQNGD
ncbi:hypothetical protein ACFLYX_03120 [Chloroflexota bacterium]